MDILQNLWYGVVSIMTTPENILLMIGGCFLGTLVGALPGMGAASGTAILLPLTFGMDPLSSLVLLLAVYYGTQFGGAITAILINVPGTTSSAVTAIDGYAMVKQGKAGKALGMSHMASFIGGEVSTILLALIGVNLARYALKFSAPEYFALTLMGLSLISGLTGKHSIKGYVMMVVGLFLSTIGIDLVTAVERFDFNNIYLVDGLEMVPVLVGLFGFSELLVNLEKGSALEDEEFTTVPSLRELMPSRKEWKDSSGALFRGTVIGFFVGVMPGAGAAIASALSYSVEKKFSKNRDNIGKGAIEGIATSESSNNSSVGGAMVSMLSLGIPGSPATAILLTALIMVGITPGPTLFTTRGDIVWPLISSMLIGNIVCLAINLLGIPAFLKAIQASKKFLNPVVAVLCVMGCYALNGFLFDVWTMIFFGVLGYFMKKYQYPALPLILALILGSKMETSLRQSLLMSAYDFSIFFTRPIACVMLIICFIGFFNPLIKKAIGKMKAKKV